MNGDIHIQQVQLRQKRNLILFIISYVINNLASGILYDTYVNYLQEVSLPTATSFWAFYGYATFLSALILLLVPKSGYKNCCCSVRHRHPQHFLRCVCQVSTILLVNASCTDRSTAAFHYAGSLCGSICRQRRWEEY